MDQNQEWVSIGDFMAGIIAVMMLMFIVAALSNQLYNSTANNTIANYEHAKDSLEKALGRQMDKNDSLLASLTRGDLLEVEKRGLVLQWLVNFRQQVREDVLEEYFIIDTTDLILVLKAGTFEKGSACLIPSIQSALNGFSGVLKEGMDENEEIMVIIAGHTDTTRVDSPNNSCGYFYDNVSLSTRRAESARGELIRLWGSIDLKERVGILGYGETKPIDPVVEDNNRRVEIKFEFLR